MNRLTEWDEFGNADIIALSDMMPELYAELSFSETNDLTDAINRLAAYEDTGLMPEEIPERMVMLPPVCYKEDGDGCAYQTYDGTDEPIDECKECPLCCIDKQRHKSPNEPLTLEELRGMDGEPVWVEFPECPEASGWMLVDVNRHCVHNGLLGDTWLAYRRKPEEGMSND